MELLFEILLSQPNSTQLNSSWSEWKTTSKKNGRQPKKNGKQPQKNENGIQPHFIFF